LFSSLEHHFSRVGKQVHLVKTAEVPHQFKEEADVGHLVQQVLIVKLFRLFVSNGLQELSRAFAVSSH
jgi:hypothetical protein